MCLPMMPASCVAASRDPPAHRALPCARLPPASCAALVQDRRVCARKVGRAALVWARGGCGTVHTLGSRGAAAGRVLGAAAAMTLAASAGLGQSCVPVRGRALLRRCSGLPGAAAVVELGLVSCGRRGRHDRWKEHLVVIVSNSVLALIVFVCDFQQERCSPSLP